MRWLMNLVMVFARLEAAVLPVSWLLAMGRWSARLMYTFLPGMRRALLDNGRYLLGSESGQAERKALALEVLTNFTRFFVEMLVSPYQLPSQRALPDLVRGWEHGEQARARDRGVICVTLHMGNYELGPMVLPELVQPVAVVYTPDPWGVFDALRSRTRQRNPVREIPVGRSPLFTVEAKRVLEEKGVVLAAADIGFPHQRGQSYPFLGGKARFLDWPARLSRTSGAPLLPCICVREEDGEYRVHLEPMIDPAGHADAGEMMARLVGVFAEYVRNYPEQWLILHRYWHEGEETRDS